MELRISNAYETHFFINFDNNCMLGFEDEKHIKYADVTAGCRELTMVLL